MKENYMRHPLLIMLEFLMAGIAFFLYKISLLFYTGDIGAIDTLVLILAKLSPIGMFFITLISRRKDIKTFYKETKKSINKLFNKK